MKARTSVIWSGFAIGVAACIGYGAHGVTRIRCLEGQLQQTVEALQATDQQLSLTIQRLEKVEAKLVPHIQLLGSNDE